MEETMTNQEDNPLEHLIHDGGMMNIFRSIGCIGDSLSSGEFEYDDNGAKGYWDCFEHSWGKYIERATGIAVTNFSRGGLTAHNLYLTADLKSSDNPEINRLFEKENAKQAYIIALGENDLKGAGVLENQYGGEIGCAETDICLSDYTKNAVTFVGDYARIIQRLQTIQPDAKFFLITMPAKAAVSPLEAQFSEVIGEIAERLSNCYVIDLYRYGVIHDSEFGRKYYCGHMNAMGYLYTAWQVMTYIDWIIRTRPMEFRYVQFIGSGYEPFQKKP